MDLHAAGADDVEGSDHALDELDHLVEALVADAPGAVDEEDHVRLGAFAHCGEGHGEALTAGRASRSQ